MSDDQALDPRWFQFSSSRPPQTDTQTLLRLLKHAEAAVRWHAAEELFYSQDPAAVDALTEVLRNDTKFSVREMAAQALGAMFQAGIPVPIFAAVVKPDADTRMSLVIERLRELGVKVIVEETQFKLHVPHKLSVTVAMEVGFLMAQLMHTPFPDGFAPFSGVISTVVPAIQNPKVSFHDSQPSVMDFRIRR